MNLAKLYDLQRKLDAHIEKEHPRQDGENRLAKKILALKVELGELANELPEVFKFWSNRKNNYEKALKEYVDGLHFLLSIGLEEVGRYGEVYPIYSLFHLVEPIKYKNITEQFNYLFYQAGYFMDCVCLQEFGADSEIEEQYEQTFSMFLGLGEMLGFTWEEIEQAYFRKNKINHERQVQGY